MRKHVSTTRLTHLEAVLQDASKSYVAFLLLCSVRCGHRGLRPMPIVALLCYVYVMILSWSCVTDNSIPAQERLVSHQRCARAVRSISFLLCTDVWWIGPTTGCEITRKWRCERVRRSRGHHITWTRWRHLAACPVNWWFCHVAFLTTPLPSSYEDFGIISASCIAYRLHVPACTSFRRYANSVTRSINSVL